MSARTLMIQGTSSSVGKSLLVTALCRIYTRRGYDVSPFKSQNMALNSFVTPDGFEIGRAQAMQAAAAKKKPSVLFNPILLKPESDGSSQIILMGKPWNQLKGTEYYSYKDVLWNKVTLGLEKLRQKSEIIFVEGAGSPAEINLKKHEIVNMKVASYLNAPVLLTADIDRGGVFAFLYGTLELLEPHEKNLIRGIIINKFRGNIDLLTPGIKMLEELTGHIPTVGVLPYINDLKLAQEDSVFLDENKNQPFGKGTFDIVVIKLPHISNYDDFDALTLEENVRIRFVRSIHELGTPRAILIPGSKTTIPDLIWLKSTGLAREILKAARNGVSIAGICGGYQMMGRIIRDSSGVEGIQGSFHGLGLLDTETDMHSKKKTLQTEAKLNRGNPFTKDIIKVKGYQIHMGTTILGENAKPLFTTNEAGFDGAYSVKYSAWGTYIHGIFDTHDFRRKWLRSIGWSTKLKPVSLSQKREEEFERLADIIEEHLDMKLLDSIIGL